jgi:hypothetical protein
MRSSTWPSRLLEVCRAYAPVVRPVSRQALERWLPSPGQGTEIAVAVFRTRLNLFCVVRGTYKTSACGGLKSCRDTIATGRVFAASPRSANQTSPGCGLIEQVENLLFSSARADQIQHVLVGEFDDLRHALSHLSGRFRLPLAQPCVQSLHQYIHGDILPHIQSTSAGLPRRERRAAPCAPALQRRARSATWTTSRPSGIRIPGRRRVSRS